MTDTTTKPKTCGGCAGFDRDMGRPFQHCGMCIIRPRKRPLRVLDGAPACAKYQPRPANASAEGEGETCD